MNLPTADELKKNQARMQELIEKKYAYRTKPDGLSAEEQAELAGLFAWQRELMDEMTRQFQTLTPGDRAQLEALAAMRAESERIERTPPA